MPISLPSKVQRLPSNDIVDPKVLKVGDQFIHAGFVWTVKEVTGDGIDCVVDPTRFIYGR